MKKRFFLEGMSRDRFEDELLNFLEIKKGQGRASVFVLIREVVKNIYQHADGKGKVLVSINRAGILCFIARDFGTAAFDLAEIKRHGSTKMGNGENYGFGLCGGMIEMTAQDLHMRLRIDTSRGFYYRGHCRLETAATKT